MSRTEKAQKWIDGVVKNEIMGCATDIVEFILRASQESRELADDAPFTWDDVEYGHVDHEDEIDELQEKIDALYDAEVEEPEQRDDEDDEEFQVRWNAWDKADDERLTEISDLEAQRDELEDEQNETPEVYEWWEVDNMLADDLAAIGETVIRGWHSYWGRSCSGQAISMDYTMDQLYQRWYSKYGRDMEQEAA